MDEYKNSGFRDEPEMDHQRDYLLAIKEGIAEGAKRLGRALCYPYDYAKMILENKVDGALS